jgi:retron-type reverse transcriptase
LSGDSFLLNNINLKWLIIVSQELKAGMFKFKPIHRVYIFKPKKKNITEALTIDNFREKIVQQAIYIILNAIYESSFLNSSHDFYFNESTYKVLKEMKYKFQDVK